MVYAPGGSFEMGSAASQVDAALRLCEEYPDAWGKCELERFQVESPQHLVTLDSFWLDRTEVKAVLDVDRHASELDRVRAEASAKGVRGVPTLVAGDRVLEGVHDSDAILAFLGSERTYEREE